MRNISELEMCLIILMTTTFSVASPLHYTLAR